MQPPVVPQIEETLAAAGAGEETLQGVVLCVPGRVSAVRQDCTLDYLDPLRWHHCPQQLPHPQATVLHDIEAALIGLRQAAGRPEAARISGPPAGGEGVELLVLPATAKHCRRKVVDAHIRA